METCGRDTDKNNAHFLCYFGNEVTASRKWGVAVSVGSVIAAGFMPGRTWSGYEARGPRTRRERVLGLFFVFVPETAKGQRTGGVGGEWRTSLSGSSSADE